MFYFFPNETIPIFIYLNDIIDRHQTTSTWLSRLQHKVVYFCLSPHVFVVLVMFPSFNCSQSFLLPFRAIYEEEVREQTQQDYEGLRFWEKEITYSRENLLVLFFRHLYDLLLHLDLFPNLSPFWQFRVGTYIVFYLSYLISIIFL